jgi:hypothetical protein
MKDAVNLTEDVIGASNEKRRSLDCISNLQATTPQVINGSGWKMQTPTGLAVVG